MDLAVYLNISGKSCFVVNNHNEACFAKGALGGKVIIKYFKKRKYHSQGLSKFTSKHCPGNF